MSSIVCHFCKAVDKAVRNGSLYRKRARKYIARYICRGCGTSFLENYAYPQEVRNSYDLEWDGSKLVPTKEWR